jgi:hypothetical protein
VLRNKIEHRHQTTIAAATAGYAQACVINYENELTDKFGSEWSLAETLRFPIFVSTFTQERLSTSRNLKGEIPSRINDFIREFTSDLAPGVAEDQRFEFRLHLVPKKGAKSEADMAIEFIRWDELSDDEKEIFLNRSNNGTVIVRDQHRPVAGHGLMRPTAATAEIRKRIPFNFTIFGHFVPAWKNLKVRPPTGDRSPQRTDERYCVYYQPAGDYLYTEAFVKKVVREIDTEEGFRTFFGRDPVYRDDATRR